MSHLVTIRTQVRDAAALAAACRRLGLPDPVAGTATMFATEAHGQVVHLPGWTYPVVADIATGELRYDNFNGSWGETSQLHRLLHAYACEKAKLEARRAGHTVVEQPLPDGFTKLTVQIGGAP